MNNYFSSDWHLQHRNILKYDKRPFKTIDEMDEAIIKNVRTLLKPGDNLYYLGDFAMMANVNKIEGFLKTLAYSGANLFFIKGNHDGHKDTVKLYKKYGNYLGEQTTVTINSQQIILNHYAMRVWRNSHHGSWHLYGHSHDSLEHIPWGKSMDVGITTAARVLGEYTLFEFADIKNILDKRDIHEIDHHIKSNR